MTTRPDTLQGSLPLLVLNVLARRGPLHGYAITSRIHELSDVLRVEEGSLYPALHRTAAGRRQLDVERERWRSITAAVNHVLKHA